MLADAGIEVIEERSTRHEPLTAAAAKALIARAERLWVARGRKLEELDPAAAGPADLTGPTGNFRAPLLLIDGTLLVGFHRDALAALVPSRRPARRQPGKS